MAVPRDSVPVVQRPAQSPAVRAHRPPVGDVDLPPLHGRDGAGAQDLGAVRGGAAVEVHLGQPQHVGGARQDTPVRPRGTGHHVPGGRRFGFRPVARQVTHRRTEGQRLLGQGHGVGQAQGGDDPLLQGLVPGAAGDDLDDAAEDAVADAAVGDGGAGRAVERHVAGGPHVCGQAVVAAPAVVGEVTGEAAGVAEQPAHRDRPVRPGGAGRGELRQDLADGRVQVQSACVDELHDQGGGVDLGYRAELEHRVGGGLHPCSAVQQAARQLVDPPVGEHRERGAGYVVGGPQRVEAALPVGR